MQEITGKTQHATDAKTDTSVAIALAIGISGGRKKPSIENTMSALNEKPTKPREMLFFDVEERNIVVRYSSYICERCKHYEYCGCRQPGGYCGNHVWR
ncbi:MAG: hypothetical protein RSC06_00955 [Clostridia bacterium]